MIWHRRCLRQTGRFTGIICMLVGSVLSCAASVPAIEQTFKEHTQAVELARGGNYTEGIRILRKLLDVFPDDYALNRDLILVLNWNNDCESALKQFDRISTHLPFEAYFSQAVADCAVKVAQAGEHARALHVLDILLIQQPNNYPMARDRAVITAWQGNCEAAVSQYYALPNQSKTEKYLAVAIGDCMLEINRPREAAIIARAGLIEDPVDEELQHLLEKTKIALIDNESYKKELIAEVSTNENDQGLREWQQYLEFSTPLTNSLRIYSRFVHTYSDEVQYSSGNQHRVGLGIRHQYNEQWSVQAEASNDIKQSGQSGGMLRLQYFPRDTLNLSAMVTNYAEDLPLRARSSGVTAKQQQIAIEYEDLYDLWYGHAILNRWDFSDSNQRHSEFFTFGYGYFHQPAYAQYLYVEAYQSHNSLVGTDYFNPVSDQSLGLIHKTNLIYSTSYQRHVDSLYLAVANYSQTGYVAHGVWSVRFEQNFDFDNTHHLNWSLGYGRHVYDGAVEYQNDAFVRYVWQFGE